MIPNIQFDESDQEVKKKGFNAELSEVKQLHDRV